MKLKAIKLINIYMIILSFLIITVFISKSNVVYAEDSEGKIEFILTDINGNNEIEKNDFINQIDEFEGLYLYYVDLYARSLVAETQSLSGLIYDINLSNNFSELQLLEFYSVQQRSGISNRDVWTFVPYEGEATTLILNINSSYFSSMTIDDSYVHLGTLVFALTDYDDDPSIIPDGFYIEQDYSPRVDNGHDVTYYDDGDTIQYNPEDLKFTNMIIGDPDAGPSAKLASLKIEGTTTTYLNLDTTTLDTNNTFRKTISYADSLDDNLVITPIAVKPSDVTIDIERTSATLEDDYDELVTITVTDNLDSNVKEIYKIELTVTPANDNTDISFTTNKTPISASFNGSNPNLYEILVDYNTLEINVIPIVHELSKVDLSVLSFTNLQPGVSKTMDVKVTAEDGTINTYTVSVLREAGNSDIDYELDVNSTTLTKEGRTYQSTLSETTSLFTIVVKDLASTTNVYYYVGSTTSVNPSDYISFPINKTLTGIQIAKNQTITYTILAIAQDGTTDYSYVEVMRSPSTNTALTKVTVTETAGAVSEKDLTPLDSKYTYTLLNNNATKLTFTATGVANEGASILITDSDNNVVSEVNPATLSLGDNLFNIIVTAQDGTTTATYELIIVKLSDLKEVVNIELINIDTDMTVTELSGFTYDAGIKRYTYTFDYAILTSFELVLTTSDGSRIVIGQTETSSNTKLFIGTFNSKTLQNISFQNNIIKAENGSVSDSFEIRLTRRAADTNNKLDDLTLNGTTVFGFNPNTPNYETTSFDRNMVNLSFDAILPENSKATIAYYINNIEQTSNDGQFMYQFTNHNVVNVQVRVTSESGVTFTYTVPVIAANSNSSIKNIKIIDTATNSEVFNSFDKTVFDYHNIQLPYSVSTIKVIVEMMDQYATYDGVVSNGTYALTPNSPLVLSVFGRSESGIASSDVYDFTITRQNPRTFKDLSTLVIEYTTEDGLVSEALDLSKGDKFFEYRVDNHITPIIITATVLGADGEKISGAASNTYTTTQIFTTGQNERTIVITVLDEAGNTNVYNIKLVRKNNDKTFESVTIGSRTYGINEFVSNTLTLDSVLFAVDRLNVTFNMNVSSNSTIQSASTFIGNNLSGIWYLNTTNNYNTVTFKVRSEYGEESDTYTIRVYREAALEEKSINTLEIETNDGTQIYYSDSVDDQKIDIRVDRFITNVIITTTVPLADRSSINAPFNRSADQGMNKVYTYDMILLNPNASASTVQKITVVAEDGSTKEYTITVWRRNANIQIDNFIIKNGEDIIFSGKIEDAALALGTFSYSVSNLTFIIEPIDEYSRITLNDGTRLEPVGGVITIHPALLVGNDRTLSLRIQTDIRSDEYSLDYDTITYNFTYSKTAASNITEIDALSVTAGGSNLLDGLTIDFSAENEIGPFIVPRSVSAALIEVTVKNNGTFTGAGLRSLSIGENRLKVEVKSESGSHSKEYTIIIYRNDDNNNILDINIVDFTLGFDETIKTYDLGTVQYSVDTLEILVDLENSYAKYYVNNVLNATSHALLYGVNTIRIKAQSDYGTMGDEYVITVFRQSPYEDVNLTDLELYFDGGTTNQITYIPGTYSYLIELDASDTPITFKILASLKDMMKQYIDPLNVINHDILVSYQGTEINQTIKFTVYAENNKSQEYTIIIKKGVVLSNDNQINDILITDNFTSTNYITFDETILTYAFDVDYKVDKVNVLINLNDNHAKVVYLINQTNLVVGTNKITFYVEAENGDIGETYTVNITRKAPSTNNALNELYIEDTLNIGSYLLGLADKNPIVTFDGKQTYTITLNENYLNQFITIQFVKGHSAQTVTGHANTQVQLSQKQNKFTINVAPEDTSATTKAYVVDINIEYEQNRLTGLSLDNQVMDLSDSTINFTTLKDEISILTTTENAFGKVEIRNSLGVLITNGKLNLNFDDNVFTVEVYSEIGDLIETYNLEIFREKHTDKDILSVTLNGDNGINYLTNFDASTLTYSIEVPLSVNSVVLNVTASHTATVFGNGTYTLVADETKVITFNVTAQNGDVTDTYIIHVTKRTPSTNNTLNELYMADPLNTGKYLLGLADKNPNVIFDGQQTYTITLSENYLNEFITIRFVKGHSAQTVTGHANIQLQLTQKVSKYEIYVKPEDVNGTTSTYVVNVLIKYESNALTSLKLDNDTMDLSDSVISYATLKDEISILTTTENTFGKVEIKNSLGVLITNGKLNLNFDENIFTVEVYNELGILVESYTLEVTRQKHADKDVTNVLLTGNDGKNYLNGFDESILTYNIEVPLSINSVVLNVTASSTATVNGNGSYTIVLDEVKTITFQVVAENGDLSDLYTINVTKRSLSTENQLEEIRFRDPLDNTQFIFGLDTRDPEVPFTSEVTNYTINLGLNYIGQTVVVRYELGDPNQTVNGISQGHTLLLKRGENSFSITVLPEDMTNGEPLVYLVKIVVLNDENGLDEIILDNEKVELTPDGKIEYETELDLLPVEVIPLNNDGEVIIKDKNNQVVHTPLSLEMGQNDFTIEFMNEFGEVTEIIDLIVERKPSSDNQVLSASLVDSDNQAYLAFNDKVKTYKISLPYDVADVTLTILANLKSKIYIDNIEQTTQSFSFVGGETQIIEFYVVAENGSKGDVYQLEITRLYATMDQLLGLTIGSNQGTLLDLLGFDPSKDYYYIQVNESHQYVVFSYISDYGQLVSGVEFNTNLALLHGLNTFIISVQPEDPNLSPFEYVIDIELINSEIELTKLEIDGEDILKPGQLDYTLLDVSSDTKSIDIWASLSDINGLITINGDETNGATITLVPGLNKIIIEVTSEDGQTVKNYIVEVTQLLETIDILEELSVQSNLDHYLLGLNDKSPDQLFDPLTNTYTFNVDETVSSIVVDYIGSLKQTITGLFNQPLNINHGQNIFEFIVQPEDPNLNSRTYKLIINQIYSDVNMDRLIVNGTNIYETDKFDYVVGDFTTDQQTIEVIPQLDNNYGSYEMFDHLGNLVTSNLVPLVFGENVITIHVISEDGHTTKVYTITANQVYSSEKEIIDVKLFDLKTNANNLNFDAEIMNYDIKFGYATSNIRLRVETHNKAKVFIDGKHQINTRSDYQLIPGQTITITLYIEAEDGSLSDLYTINVYRRLADENVLSNNTSLLDVTLEVPIEDVLFDFDPAIREYTIHIPYIYDEIYLKGHPEVLGAIVVNEGAYYLEAGIAKVVYLRVIAQDGTVSNDHYKITLIRDLPDSNTTLKSLEVQDLNGGILPFDQAIFDPENRIYTLKIEEGISINKVNIVAVKQVDSQTVYNVGVVDLLGELEGSYNTIITVTVVAEDESIGTYVIYVLHDLDFASIAEVKDISIIGDDGRSYFGLEFSHEITQYDVSVPFNLTQMRLIVQTIGNVIYLDENLNEIEDNRIQTFDASNLIEYRFKIQSTNTANESLVYTIILSRELADGNNLLDSILINGNSVLSFDPTTNTYEYIHPIHFDNKIDVVATPQSPTSVVSGNATYELEIGQTKAISLVVTAQDGSTNTYTVYVKYVNSNALLGELTVYELDQFNIEFENPVELIPGQLEYLVKIDKDTQYVNIKGSAEDQGGANIRGFGRYKVGDSPLVIPIVVTSGDQTEEVIYLITITKDYTLPSDASLQYIKINQNGINDFSPNQYVYNYNVGRSSEKMNLGIRSNDRNATIYVNDVLYDEIDGLVIENLSSGANLFQIKVVAADGETVTYYTLVIDKASEPSMLLTVLLILSILLWVITMLIWIFRRNRKNKNDRNELIF